MSAQLRARNGGLALSGELDFATVPPLYEGLSEALELASDAVVVDLSQIARADSAGLALLLELKRVAKSLGRSLRFSQAPEQLVELAKANKLDAILALSGR